jgi:hypothetical protein
VRRRSAALGTALLVVAAMAGTAAATSITAGTGSLSTQVTGSLPDGGSWIADMPAHWNGTLLLYSHGFGSLSAQDTPDPATAAALLARGYALAGSSYDPGGSLWALNSAVRDQFETLQAVEAGVLPARPRQVIAFGQSMGGLVSALEAQTGAGRINGALTTCGIVAGAINLNNYQLDGEYTIARLIAAGQQIPLVRFTSEGQAIATAQTLTAAAVQAQQTRAGRARLGLAMAFLNVPAWAAGQPAPPGPSPDAQEAGQYQVYFGGPPVLAFIEGARPAIELAAGGNGSWTQGTDFAALLHRSPYQAEIAALYREAGLSLRADLATLTHDADIVADPAALRSLAATSVPTGHLEVPELDLHTISDQLVPVQQENFYAGRVRAAGSGTLLRQAYVARVGHCNFTPAELVAGVMAIRHRVTTGRWDSVAQPGQLEQAALGLGLGDAAFIDYQPGPLSGVSGTLQPGSIPGRR